MIFGIIIGKKVIAAYADSLIDMWFKSFGPEFTQSKTTIINKLHGIMRDYDNKGMLEI